MNPIENEPKGGQYYIENENEEDLMTRLVKNPRNWSKMNMALVHSVPVAIPKLDFWDLFIMYNKGSLN